MDQDPAEIAEEETVSAIKKEKTFIIEKANLSVDGSSVHSLFCRLFSPPSGHQPTPAKMRVMQHC